MSRLLRIVAVAFAALLLVSCTGRPAPLTFTVTGLSAGQRAVLYDRATGAQLSRSAPATAKGVVTVPLDSTPMADVFVLCTLPDGVTGSGVASREMTVSARESFSCEKWRDAPRSGDVELYFDDGAMSVWQYGRPLLKEFGVQAILPIITESASRANAGKASSDVMSWAQISDMAKDGHEIASHTRTHANLTKLNDAQLTSEIAGSAEDLRSHGFRVSEIVYPFGATNSRVLAMAKRYYSRGRGGLESGEATTKPFEARSVDAGVSSGEVRDYIDAAVAQSKSLNLMYHGVHPPHQEASGAWIQAPYEISPDLLRAHLAYLVSSGIGYQSLSPTPRK